MNHQFCVGEIVHHKRYDYRGVIAAWDPCCRASEEWHAKNMTQPNKEQPWYHILVDGGSTTYVAEENLEMSCDRHAIKHPLVCDCFVSFYEGRYYQVSMN